MIVELNALPAFVPLGIAPTFGPNAASHELLALRTPDDLRVGGLLPLRLWIIKQRSQALSLKISRRLQTAQLRKSRIEIQQLDSSRAGAPSSFRSGR